MSTFVENRLKEIRQYTDIDFRYVVTDENPADIASCGMHFNELKSNNLLWNVPTWLLFSCDELPIWSYDMTVKDNDVLKSELKTSSVNGQTELLVGEPLEGKIYWRNLTIE